MPEANPVTTIKLTVPPVGFSSTARNTPVHDVFAVSVSWNSAMSVPARQGSGAAGVPPSAEYWASSWFRAGAARVITRTEDKERGITKTETRRESA